ncbi:hypothetical protein PSPO01_06577 [Paraphaeosphaeria sporulosa]
MTIVESGPVSKRIAPLRSRFNPLLDNSIGERGFHVHSVRGWRHDIFVTRLLLDSRPLASWFPDNNTWAECVSAPLASSLPLLAYANADTFLLHSQAWAHSFRFFVPAARITYRSALSRVTRAKRTETIPDAFVLDPRLTLPVPVSGVVEPLRVAQRHCIRLAALLRGAGIASWRKSSASRITSHHGQKT